MHVFIKQYKCVLFQNSLNIFFDSIWNAGDSMRKLVFNHQKENCVEKKSSNY